MTGLADLSITDPHPATGKGNEYSSVLNRSHVATIWNFDPNYSLPSVTKDSLPKMFQIVATWLQFSTEE